MIREVSIDALWCGQLWFLCTFFLHLSRAEIPDHVQIRNHDFFGPLSIPKNVYDCRTYTWPVGDPVNPTQNCTNNKKDKEKIAFKSVSIPKSNLQKNPVVILLKPLYFVDDLLKTMRLHETVLLC